MLSFCCFAAVASDPAEVQGLKSELEEVRRELERSERLKSNFTLDCFIGVPSVCGWDGFVLSLSFTFCSHLFLLFCSAAVEKTLSDKDKELAAVKAAAEKSAKDLEQLRAGRQSELDDLTRKHNAAVERINAENQKALEAMEKRVKSAEASVDKASESLEKAKRTFAAREEEMVHRLNELDDGLSGNPSRPASPFHIRLLLLFTRLLLFF